MLPGCSTRIPTGVVRASRLWMQWGKRAAMLALTKHATERWVVLYIERRLKAPMQEDDRQLVPREKGTPQGGVQPPAPRLPEWPPLRFHRGMER